MGPPRLGAYISFEAEEVARSRVNITGPSAR